jgi:hypothetical protein
MAATTNNELETTASALLEAIVQAEIELHTLAERCASLEEAIGHERASIESILPRDGGGTAEPRLEEIRPTLTLAPMAQSPARPAAREAVDAEAAADEQPSGPVTAEEIVGRAANEADERARAADVANEAEEPAPEPLEAPQGVPRSLEEQAAALRAAMAGETAPAPATKPVESAARGGGTPSPAREREPASDDAPETADLDRRPFQPKRTSPLKSRLAGGEAPPSDEESYSERSAELEHLLRSREA